MQFHILSILSNIFNMAFVGSGIGSVCRIFPQRARHFRTTCPTMVQKGDRVPDVSVMVLKDGNPSPAKAPDFFTGKKVALVSVPGALTSTCQNQHIAQWVKKADEVKSKGVDDIICIAVNDPFVMDAFEKVTNGTGKVTFVADGGAALTKALDIDIDTGDFGGIRAKRASFLVEDGVFTQVNMENGTSFEGPSKPETILSQL